ncbi:MerR family transcriptional regulator [Methylocystis sp.]|uniref:MerR family transcriptional regulator n=1 Tax=Methylocystis sp. TaxID=1911079 RepID=UPI0039648560
MRTIGEVAASLDLPAHVLRFWETRFKQISPLKRAGGRRLYRQRDIDLVIAIRRLLYEEGYTIRGVQRILKENGVEAVIAGAGRRQEGEPPIGAPRLPFPAGALYDEDGPPESDQAEADDQDDAASDEDNDPTLAPSGHRAQPRQAAEREARLLREVLAELEECKRLLRLTKL